MHIEPHYSHFHLPAVVQRQLHLVPLEMHTGLLQPTSCDCTQHPFVVIPLLFWPNKHMVSNTVFPSYTCSDMIFHAVSIIAVCEVRKIKMHYKWHFCLSTERANSKCAWNEIQSWFLHKSLFVANLHFASLWSSVASGEQCLNLMHNKLVCVVNFFKRWKWIIVHV